MPHTRPKLLYIITKSNYGGAQRYVHELAVRFSKDHDVVVAHGGSGILAERLDEHRVRHIHIASMQRDINIVSELRAFVELWRIVRHERPDIVHLNSSKTLALGGVVCRLAGVRTIVSTIHGWPYFDGLPVYAQWFRRFSMRIAIYAAHVMIFVSQRDIDHPLVPVPHAKCRLIYNGVAAPSGERVAYAAVARHALTIAELTPRKNVRAVIDAIVAYNHTAQQPLSLDIMGDGEQRTELEQYARTHDSHDAIQFLGFVRDYRTTLAAYDLFLLPSKKEGLPYVLLDAGAAGIPCIASNVDGIPEIIVHNETGLLVEPHDSAALADAVQMLAPSPTLRQQYGTALQERVATQHNFETMIERTRTAYGSRRTHNS